MRVVLNSLLVVAVALGLGLSSAWYMIDRGSALTTDRIGPWSVWYAAGNPKADPYTKAHFARSGRLPITSTSAVYYLASTDGRGEKLTSECEYVVEGRPFNAPWWSLTVYDEDGRLIANKARRHGFTSHELVMRPDGTYRVVLAPTVTPGNWLPTGEGKTLQLVIRIYRPRDSDSAVRGNTIAARLPAIRRVGCR